MNDFLSRSPRGERGLKSPEPPALAALMVSLPSRGARVEIGLV